MNYIFIIILIILLIDFIKRGNEAFIEFIKGFGGGIILLVVGILWILAIASPLIFYYIATRWSLLIIFLIILYLTWSRLRKNKNNNVNIKKTELPETQERIKPKKKVKNKLKKEGRNKMMWGHVVNKNK